MSLVLKANQRCGLSIQPVDAKGNPAPVDGVPLWEVTEPAVLSLAVAEDGLSAVVRPIGPVGFGQIKVSCDADLGEGIVAIGGVLDVEVIAGPATVVNVTPGVPEDE